MARLAAVALGVASVVGVTGGVAAATLTHPASPGTARTTTTGTQTGPPATGTPTPSSAPTTTTPLLYADASAIHDGTRTVALHGPTGLVALQRTATGYLVTGRPGKDQPYEQWRVAPDGSTDGFASTGDLGDVNQDGTLLVAPDAETGQTTVWDLTTGDVVARWAKSTDATGSAAFVGHDVYVNQYGDGNAYELWRWDPDTGTSTKTTQVGLSSMQASPGGAFVAGETGPDGPGPVGTGCTSLESTYLKNSPVGWTTCDGRLAGHPGSFSPDGTRVALVPRHPKAPYLRRVVVLDATRGPKQAVTDFSPPARTESLQWSGDDHLLLTGSRTTGGTWVARCALVNGDCVRVVTSRDAVVVGSTS